MTLPREAWPQLKAVFEGARALALDARPAYLAAACGRDEALRQEVETLLASHDQATSFLETPAVLFDDTIVTKNLEGQRIGPYQLTSRIGAGGMGEVYRARDTKLNRHVAIKFLLPAVANDPDRLARFSREAQFLASLNHPHIAQIHGLEDAGGLHALVMELVEGPTLADRIAQGALPLDETLPMAKQIAEALEAAHEQRIVHRDLKPANIKVRADGTVKVLDFGLAKAFDPTGSARLDAMNLPTLSVPATQAGIILGTAAYMSPEQARGRPVDKRADLWAFGAVLYEMLTGQRAFAGDAVSDILASVLMQEPNWSGLPPQTPAPIRRLLRRCLEKDPSRRLDSAAGARLEIDDALKGPRTDADVVPSATRNRERLAWTALAVVTLIAVVAVVRTFRPVPPESQIRLDIATLPTTDRESLAISPDGHNVVFVATPDGEPRLWLRSLDSTARPLAGTDNASFPFWSPDSRSVGFFGGGKLKRIDLVSGSVHALADADGRGGTWSLSGVIVFSPSPAGPLFRVPASGGEAVALKLDVPHTSTAKFPHYLPDGRRFLFYAEGSPDSQGIYLGSLDSSETKRLTAADTAGAYLPPGWLLFIRQGTLVARHFDLSREELTGDPVTVADQVGFDSRSNVGAFSVSAAGIVAYRSGGPPRQLMWFDRSGKALETMGAPDENDLVAPALSRDGRRVVVHRVVQGNTDLWLLDGARMTRFTSYPGMDRFPLWSPDGGRVVFGSNRKGARDLYWKPSSGAGTEELLLESPQDKAPNSWSPDSHFLLYTNMDPKSGPDLSVLPLDGDRKPFVFLSTRFDERVGQFSPDGHWVAYQSNASGRNEVYVRPFPGPGGESQVSTSGGIQPRWRPDGKELYYIAPDGKLMAVPITVKGATLEPGVPAVLFRTRIWGGGTNAGSRQQYDVALDGRFLINVTTADATNAPITVLLNWKPKP